MKRASTLLVVVCWLLVSYPAFALTFCLECFDRIDDNEKFCVACKTKLSVDTLETKEKQLIHAVTVSRENYRKSLDELRAYYQTIGNQMRLRKARRELDALNNVPRDRKSVV